MSSKPIPSFNYGWSSLDEWWTDRICASLSVAAQFCRDKMPTLTTVTITTRLKLHSFGPIEANTKCLWQRISVSVINISYLFGSHLKLKPSEENKYRTKIVQAVGTFLNIELSSYVILKITVMSRRYLELRAVRCKRFNITLVICFRKTRCMCQ